MGRTTFFSGIMRRGQSIVFQLNGLKANSKTFRVSLDKSLGYAVPQQHLDGLYDRHTHTQSFSLGGDADILAGAGAAHDGQGQAVEGLALR